VFHVGSMDLEEEPLDGFVDRPLIPQRYGVLLNYEQKLYLRRCHVTFFNEGKERGKGWRKGTKSHVLE
jgi:hypothetical protein